VARIFTKCEIKSLLKVIDNHTGVEKAVCDGFWFGRERNDGFPGESLEIKTNSPLPKLRPCGKRARIPDFPTIRTPRSKLGWESAEKGQRGSSDAPILTRVVLERIGSIEGECRANGRNRQRPGQRSERKLTLNMADMDLSESPTVLPQNEVFNTNMHIVTIPKIRNTRNGE
jgi:hypothetical protein